MMAAKKQFDNNNFRIIIIVDEKLLSMYLLCKNIIKTIYSGVHGRGIRRQMHFPRRRIIQRIIRLEEDNIKANGLIDENNSNNINHDNSGDENDLYVQPLGLIHYEQQQQQKQQQHEYYGSRYPRRDNTKIIPKPIFAESHQVRLQLAKWLPITLRQTNLELLYSTNTDGRALERFYSHVGNAKHTILICEVLPPNTDVDNTDSSNNNPGSNVILGMYASQTWRVSSEVYGDGSVFLFRLEPEAICWKWKPDKPKMGGKLIDHVNLEEDDATNNRIALLEQFMVSTPNFISMGGNTDGSCGLRINEDFTKGESSMACGYHNEPLHGLNRGSVFDIGLVEVYGFVRQIDGRSL
jgi:TLD